VILDRERYGARHAGECIQRMRELWEIVVLLIGYLPIAAMGSAILFAALSA
jgi:hypothetical protein